jgi:prefoldin subunit 5
MYEKYLSSKEEKDIKKTIKILKKKKDNLGNNKKFAKTMLETIIDRRGYLVDYMDNMQKFIDCMEG